MFIQVLDSQQELTLSLLLSILLCVHIIQKDSEKESKFFWQDPSLPPLRDSVLTFFLIIQNYIWEN